MHTRSRVRPNAFMISTTFSTTINLPQRRKSNSSRYSWGEEIWRQKSRRNLYFAASWIIARHVLCLINYKLFYDDITNVVIHRYPRRYPHERNKTNGLQHNYVIQFSISVSTCPFCARARELLLLIICSKQMPDSQAVIMSDWVWGCSNSIWFEYKAAFLSANGSRRLLCDLTILICNVIF